MVQTIPVVTPDNPESVFSLSVENDAYLELTNAYPNSDFSVLAERRPDPEPDPPTHNIPYGQLFLPGNPSICPNTFKTLTSPFPPVDWGNGLQAFDCTRTGIRYGSSLQAEVGSSDFTVWCVYKKTGAGDFCPIARYGGNPSSYLVRSEGKDLHFIIFDNVTGAVKSQATLANGWTLNEKVLVAIRFSQVAKLAIMTLIRPSGIQHLVLPFTVGSLRSKQPLYFGSRSDYTQPVVGIVAGAGVHRSLLVDEELQWIYNSGDFHPLNDFVFGPPNGEQPNRPVGEALYRGVVPCQLPQLRGEYWCRPFNLSSNLNSSWLWLVSSDHSDDDRYAGCWGQVTNSYEPSSLTPDWVKVIPANIQSGTRNGIPISLSQMETPHYVYAEGDARPHRIYAHGIVASGSRNMLLSSGANPPQETHLFTATSPLGPYVGEGPAIPTTDGPGYNDWTHSGYAFVVPPGTLPGVSQYTAYSAGRDSFDLGFVNTYSPDGRNFQIPNSMDAVVDTWTNVDLLYSEIKVSNVVAIGNKVYWVGKCRCVNEGVARSAIGMGEMRYVNGGWRQPSEKIWTLIKGTGPAPTEAYVQDVRAFVYNGQLHVFSKWGLAKENGWLDHTEYHTFMVLPQ